MELILKAMTPKYLLTGILIYLLVKDGIIYFLDKNHSLRRKKSSGENPEVPVAKTENSGNIYSEIFKFILCNKWFNRLIYLILYIAAFVYFYVD